MSNLSRDELSKREEIIQGMLKNKRTLVKRYIKDKKKKGEEPINPEWVIYGRATRIARKLRETKMEKVNLKELVRQALSNPISEKKRPDYADVDGDGNRTEPMEKAFKDKASNEGYNPDWDQEEDEINFPVSYYPDGTPINVGEDMDLGHTDNEPHMLKGDLYRIGKYAMELYQMVDEFEGKGEVDFPHWWQAKIINAREAIESAKHYLDFETKEPQIDAMVGAIDISGALDNVGVEEVQTDMFATKASKTDSGKETYFKFLRAFAKSAGKSEEELRKMSYNDLEKEFGEKLARKHGLKKINVADKARELVDKGIIQVDEIEEGIHDRDITSAPHTNVKGEMGAYDPAKAASLKKRLANFGPKKEDDKVDEKKLTKPELKKREEVAKAMEKDNPKMDMGKKMAMAATIAKRVAERISAGK